MNSIPVVLVHGARTSRTMWRAQLAALERAGVTAVAPDLPGHGRRMAETFSVDGAVGAVADAVATVGGRAIVAGVSLGGYVAIEHRARYPRQSLGLLASGCCAPPSTPLRRLWLAATHCFDAMPDGGGWLNAALVSRAMTPQGARDLAAGGFALDAMTPILQDIARCDPLSSLRRASSPVWFVNGRYDHFRLAEREFLAAARSGVAALGGAAAPLREGTGGAAFSEANGAGSVGPIDALRVRAGSAGDAGHGAGVRLILVPHARHLVSLDAPVAYNRVLLEFVDVVSGQAGASASAPASVGAAGAPASVGAARVPAAAPRPDLAGPTARTAGPTRGRRR